MENLIVSHVFVAILPIFLVTAFVRRILNSKASSVEVQPPSPLALPLIGHLHLLRPPIHRALHDLTARYGPLLRLYLGSTPCIVVSTAAHAREVFKTNDAYCSERPQTIASRQFAYNSAGFAFAPYGPHWRFVKRLCMSEVLGGRTIDQLHPIRRAELHALLGNILATASRRQQEPVDVSDELIRYTNDIIMRMATSTSAAATVEGEAGEAREVAKQVAELMGTFNVVDHIRLCRNMDYFFGLNKKIEEVHRKFDRLLESVIKRKEERRMKMKREKTKNAEEEMMVKDLLDILLDLANQDDAEMKLTRENIKAFVLDIIVAGSDSTAASVEWALSELINNPAILHKVRAEIDEVVGKQRLVEESDIPNLPFLRAVMKEVLRLHPASPMAMRQTSRDIKLGGFHVPAKSTLIVNIWSVNKDADRWAEPLEFRPERFAAGGGCDEVDVKGQHFQLLPFGGGRRMCPGMQLALPVTAVTVAALVQCFEWKVAGGGKVDMAETSGLVMAKATPLELVPVARLSPPPFPLNTS